MNTTLKSILASIATSTVVSALVGVLVTAGIDAWKEGRLETSKEKYAIVSKQKEQFDQAQMALVSQVGVFAITLMTKEPNSKVDNKEKQDLSEKITSALLSLNRLRNQVQLKQDTTVFDDYASQLEKLSKAVDGANTFMQLAPIYNTLNGILELHDKLDIAFRESINISVF